MLVNNVVLCEHPKERVLCEHREWRVGEKVYAKLKR